eukprot:10600489-Prorocentrum_lima.AAC.1
MTLCGSIWGSGEQGSVASNVVDHALAREGINKYNEKCRGLKSKFVNPGLARTSWRGKPPY